MLPVSSIGSTLSNFNPSLAAKSERITLTSLPLSTLHGSVFNSGYEGSHTGNMMTGLFFFGIGEDTSIFRSFGISCGVCVVCNWSTALSTGSSPSSSMGSLSWSLVGGGRRDTKGVAEAKVFTTGLGGFRFIPGVRGIDDTVAAGGGVRWGV